MTDATTGVTSNTMVLDGVPQRYAVEAGYASDGSLVFNQTSLDPPGDPTRALVDPVRKISLRNGRFEFRNAQGQLMYGTGNGAGPSLATMVGAGTSPPPMQILDGVLLASIPQVGAKTTFDGSSYTVTAVQQDAGMTRNESVTRISATASAPALGEPVVEQQLTYRQRSGQNVLEEAKTFVAVQANGAQMNGTSTVRFENVRWGRSVPAEDSRATGQSNTWGTGLRDNHPFEPPPCDHWSNPECIPPEPTNPTPPSPPSAPSCPLVAGGANLVFQHGLNSTASTWSPNYVRTRCDFAVGHILNESMPNRGLGRHHTQADVLRTAVVNSGYDQNIFIGHSQGGLISRRVAQNFQNSLESNYLRGVVTIGTPHWGSNLARNLPNRTLDVPISLLGRQIVCRLTSSCSFLVTGLRTINEVYLTETSGTDAALDLVPNSSALQEVNSETENFPRYGIQHYIDKRWAFMRLAGDARSEGGGVAFVTYTNLAYFGAAGGSVLTFFLGWWGASAFLARFVYQMDRTDHWWNAITAGDGESDGIVEGYSQVYPNSGSGTSTAELLNFEAATATSHTGETNNMRSYVEIEAVLRTRFGVPER